MKRLEGKIFKLSQQIISVTHERGNRNEIELRNHIISSAPSKQKQIVEKNNEQIEEPKSTPIKDEVSNETLEKWETLVKLIDKDSPFRRSKNQILNEPNPHLSDYIRPPYHLNKKKPKIKMEVGKFKKFMEMLTALQVNIPFCDALKKILVYAKFMKEILNDPGRFTIPCSIGSLKIGQTLCDLGDSINLMSLSMMRKLNYGEPKPKKMTLTLADRFVTYPYEVLEDVLVKIDDLPFPADFVILDMLEDTEIPLLLGIPFLATCRVLTDVEIRELVLWFNKE
ncbi:uncharacterized protein LOC127138032 [Lathyrus oleraceus]|uniref:uncharacterized protein LOC127138032 n=1 Tax=Pisum sativum TaxID=3888 RepID=UPI0021CE66A5|nr:uncharacterized protein LOC127138032 [Pisum sativum]